MIYEATLNDFVFNIAHIAPGEADPESVAAVLGELGRFCAEEIAPLDVPADRAGTVCAGGMVRTAPGFRARLTKLVSGQRTSTMNLTEPQADATYRITGTKIFITDGDHDLAENTLHLVLARTADAPAGVRGISLFLVPKIKPDGRRSRVTCQSVEHQPVVQKWQC